MVVNDLSNNEVTDAISDGVYRSFPTQTEISEDIKDAVRDALSGSVDGDDVRRAVYQAFYDGLPSETAILETIEEAIKFVLPTKEEILDALSEGVREGMEG